MERRTLGEIRQDHQDLLWLKIRSNKKVEKGGEKKCLRGMAWEEKIHLNLQEGNIAPGERKESP